MTIVRPLAATREALLALGRRIERARAQGPHPEPRPFMVVTPLGVPSLGDLLGALAADGVEVVGRAVVADWPEVASAIYVPRLDEDRLRIAHGFELIWREHFPAEGVVLFLSPGDHRRMTIHKHVLRTRFVSRAVELFFESSGAESSGASEEGRRGPEGLRFRSNLHALHVPDEERLGLEYAIVSRRLRPGP